MGCYTTCFFGFLRAGEICIPSDSEYDSGAHLSFSDIAADSPTNPIIMQVWIKPSKTDHFRKGVDIYLGYTHNSLFPITAMMAYLSVRGDIAGSLFHFKDRKPLTRDLFVNKLRDTWCGERKDYKQTAVLAMWWNHAWHVNEAKEGKLVCSIVACSTLHCAHAVFLALSAYSLPLLCVGSWGRWRS